MNTKTRKRTGIFLIILALGMSLFGFVGVFQHMARLAIGSTPMAMQYAQPWSALFFSDVYSYFVGVITISYTVMAIFLIFRRPDNVLSWFFIICLLFLSFQTFGLAFATNYYLTDAVQKIGALSGDAWLPTFTIPLSLMLLYFPDGKLPSRRWWPIMVATVVGMLGSYLGFTVPRFYPGILINPGFRSVVNLLIAIISMLFTIGLLGSWFSLFFRYRQSKGVVRSQMKWLLYVATILISLLVFFLASGLAETDLFQFVFFSPPIFIALAIGFSILRYRLFDIDVVIRRTLQYGLLTGTLVLLYYGGIVILQGVLGPIFGSENSTLFTVITTLGVAALFNPLRGRIQSLIDRRFYRQNFDAEKALSTFSEVTRDEVDMARLAGALLNLVDETMRPERTSLWLRRD